MSAATPEKASPSANQDEPAIASVSSESSAPGTPVSRASYPYPNPNAEQDTSIQAPTTSTPSNPVVPTSTVTPAPVPAPVTTPAPVSAPSPTPAAEAASAPASVSSSASTPAPAAPVSALTAATTLAIAPTPTPPSTAAPAPAPAATPASTTASVVGPSPGSGGGSTPSSAPVVEVSDMMDPLSHLYHIFEKIKKQVIEWGEDANWKIDVFLLPSEEGQPSSGAPTPMHGPPLGPMHHGPQSSGGGHSSSRADLSESPRRHVHGSQDVEMGHGTKSPRFILQPPPSDLPHSIGETIPTSLVAKDIANMTEAEAKRMLGVAVRQIRDQQVEMGHVMHDLETLKRVSAQRERDSEARLDVERRSMELDAMVLRRRWKEASDMLLEKDREMKDVQMQLEAGKQFIKERNEERRRRIEEQGVILPSRTTPGKEGLGLTHPAPSTPTTDSSQPGFHPHQKDKTTHLKMLQEKTIPDIQTRSALRQRNGTEVFSYDQSREWT
ncbi:hypothetical protein BGX31_001474 [Mortierella sp. GBA43]|nr:hypothetical protein BGX31_001474 [Mortierella sp. GBA43]